MLIVKFLVTKCELNELNKKSFSNLYFLPVIFKGQFFISDNLKKQTDSDQTKETQVFIL